MYTIIKTYPHSLGLTTTYRNWLAASHCRYWHGYALRFDVEIAGFQLDQRHWLVDYGALKPFREWLATEHDHITYVAQDDPELEFMLEAQRRRLVDLRIIPSVSTEAFARRAFEQVREVVRAYALDHRISAYVKSVTVWEHEANRASYTES